MVGAHVVADQRDHLVLRIAAGHIPAFAIDLLGHLNLLGPRFVERPPWAYLGATLADQFRIQLCGTLAVEINRQRIDDRLPGRQGRLLITYLVLHRLRTVRRDELVDALWPDTPPAACDAALSSLLSKLRRLLPDGTLEGRGVVRLTLPASAFVDLEVAREAIHRAESAIAQEQWHRAWGASLAPLFTARRGFLPDEDAEWIRDTRRELDALYLRALESYTSACLGVGGTELVAAERAGRELIALAPYRENGYRHLMQALSRSGNTAEALRIYEQLRTLLRDELGVAPSTETLRLHDELLRGW
jgi:SARP family transcriptional regulator, regulator of embCAB operon